MKISTPCLIIGLLALGAQAAHAQEAPQQTVQGVTPAQQVPVQQPFGVVTPRGEVGYIDVLAGLAYADNPLLTSRPGGGTVIEALLPAEGKEAPSPA